MSAFMTRAADAPVLLWFRNDLRLADQAALAAAVATGRPVLPVYVLDEAAAGAWAPGGAARWWLHHSLASLATNLKTAGAPLVLRRGSTEEAILELVRDLGVAEIHAGDAVEPWARRLERALMKTLAHQGVAFHRHRTTMLFDQEAVRTNGGTPFGVYTPFSRACLGAAQPPSPVPAPARLRAPTRVPRSDRLDHWELRPRHPDWAGGIRASWQPGEVAAQQRLSAFVTGALGEYASRRDRPGEDATSMLSPHLHWGEISTGQVWHAAHTIHGPDAEKFVRELLWREFNIHLLWHHPALPDRPLRPEFARLRWRHDRRALRAWQRGETGVPIVDAGMRQLWQTGWMHNRVRLITASFLVKHLLIPWQDGEAWFWDTLVDADLANNAGNWQWVAGCGADAAPFFRVFNPVLQGKKFDTEGGYVRRFVPELAAMEASHIHAPWEAPSETLRAAGVELGRTYPRPIVELAAARSRALAAFAALRPDAA
jgi:deoxyribodipyrimidine photo-lyase